MATEIFDSVLLLLVFVIIILLIWIKTLQSRMQKAIFDKRSLGVKYGKMSEQFFPFLEKYPYDPQNFRFLGTPIDGVQFEKDKIIFMEFKTGNAKLSLRQEEIKLLLEKGKVEFREMRVQ